MFTSRHTGCRTITEWCKGFYHLYSEADAGRRPQEFWLATMAYCSGLGEAIRRQNYSDLMFSAAHTFCWLCSYVSHIGQDSFEKNKSPFYWPVTLSETVYLKFPLVCGHCLSSPCECDAQRADQQANKGTFYKELVRFWKQSSPLEYTLSNWLHIFDGIYSSRIHLMTLDAIGFHFLEEAGEEAVGIRKILQLRGILAKGNSLIDHNYIRKLSTVEGLVEEYVYGAFPREEKTGKPKIDLTSKEEEFIKARIVDAKMDLIIELSDTFSWFCAILIKLGMLLKESNLWSERYDIETYLNDEYGPEGEDLKCPVCRQNVCACLSFHGP